MSAFAPLTPHFYAALEHGTAATREFFAGQPTASLKMRDPYLAAHLTRFHACDHLSAWGLEATMDRIWLPNSGIAVRSGPLDIRCVKADSGGVPGPGRSQVKHRFYNQMVQQGFFDDLEEGDPQVNLLIIWNVDAHGNLVALSVLSPRSANRSRESVRLYWSQELMHPAEAYQPEPPVEEEASEPDDLPGYDEDRSDESLDAGAG